MLEKFCYQTQIVFQQLECPVSETLLCGIDIGYSGIKIQSPFNASTIPSIVVKERHDAPLLVGSEDIRYRDEKRAGVVYRLAGKENIASRQYGGQTDDAARTPACTIGRFSCAAACGAVLFNAQGLAGGWL